jgi:hypothetical protein
VDTPAHPSFCPIATAGLFDGEPNAEKENRIAVYAPQSIEAETAFPFGLFAPETADDVLICR